MRKPIIDAHIHFDLYDTNERFIILQGMETNKIKSLISVSNNLSSAKKTLHLAKSNPSIKPGFGYHPEQELPKVNEVEELIKFINNNQSIMVAIGEVGLPYYLRQKNPNISIDPYIELLEIFVQQAVHYNKPLVLHAIYDDAQVVCNLLEKYSIKKAHFHWFKGDQKVIERMIDNGYFISVTPDLLYKKRTHDLVKLYPLSKLMVETDGPWPFDGPFKGKMTHPAMIHFVIQEIATIKKLDISTVYEKIYQNTKEFYSI